jgi:hypothetical protein
MRPSPFEITEQDDSELGNCNEYGCRDERQKYLFKLDHEIKVILTSMHYWPECVVIQASRDHNR